MSCGDDESVDIQVFLRCRPFSESENKEPEVVTCNEAQGKVSVSERKKVSKRKRDKDYTFDKVFGRTVKQGHLYDQAIKPVVNDVLKGSSYTVLAYGLTGTGKTYTMQGECKRLKVLTDNKRELPPEAGVIPRAVKQIVDTLDGQTDYIVKVTLLELYENKIFDLLLPENTQKSELKLVENDEGRVSVKGLMEETMKGGSYMFTLLERGFKNRKTSKTPSNKQSSQSHSIFSITTYIKEGEELIQCGKLNLVDLVGSDFDAKKGNGVIKKSLLSLERVIIALANDDKHIPYRDNNLTRLLSDSLGGKTKIRIIVTVSPTGSPQKTLGTLDFAVQAKKIKKRPEKIMKTTLNEDLNGDVTHDTDDATDGTPQQSEQKRYCLCSRWSMCRRCICRDKGCNTNCSCDPRMCKNTE